MRKVSIELVKNEVVDNATCLPPCEKQTQAMYCLLEFQHTIGGECAGIYKSRMLYSSNRNIPSEAQYSPQSRL